MTLLADITTRFFVSQAQLFNSDLVSLIFLNFQESTPAEL